jgi:hypothetical protein
MITKGQVLYYFLILSVNTRRILWHNLEYCSASSTGTSQYYKISSFLCDSNNLNSLWQKCMFTKRTANMFVRFCCCSSSNTLRYTLFHSVLVKSCMLIDISIFFGLPTNCYSLTELTSCNNRLANINSYNTKNELLLLLKSR